MKTLIPAPLLLLVLCVSLPCQAAKKPKTPPSCSEALQNLPPSDAALSAVERLKNDLRLYLILRDLKSQTTPRFQPPPGKGWETERFD